MFFLDVPLPGFDAESSKEITKLLKEFEKAASAGPIRGGVVSEGDAASYALVWEWGNSRQTKEGPKTVKGVNPDGEEVFLSVQAPFGYIAIHEPEFLNIIQTALGEADFSDANTAGDIVKEMKRVSAIAGERIAEMLRQVAPLDRGGLRESIEPADPDDPELAQTDVDIEIGEAAFSHVIRSTLKKLKG